MGMAQAKIIEEQQRTIKKLERQLYALRAIPRDCEAVKISDFAASASQILNDCMPVALTRHGFREAVIIPVKLLGGEG